jgi:predicted ATPase
MPQPELIGREQELGELVAALEEAAAGRGSVVFLAGDPGSGRTTVLGALEEAAGTRESLERLEVVGASCYELDRSNPLGPFLEILRGLTTEDRRWTRAKRTLELVRDIAPPLVGLIPGLGGIAALGVKAAAETGIYAVGDRTAQVADTHASVALALRRIAQETPLALLIDDAQWIDEPSANVVARLATLADAPLVLIVAHDAALERGHPLARVRSRAAPLRNVRSVALVDLDLETIEATLLRRYGALPHPRLAEWLHDHTDGTPYFLLETLRALEQGGVIHAVGDGWTLEGEIDGTPGFWRLDGALAETGTPADMLGILQPQVEDLEPEEALLLESGAVQGKHFLAHVVARLVARDEAAVRRELQTLAVRRRMIAPQQTRDWWTQRTGRYAFDPGLLRELLYHTYGKGAFDAQEQHRAVADALEELIADEVSPPRHALLEIAQHRELAMQPLPAARRLVDVAAAAYAEGADRESAALAEHALRLLDEVPLGPPEGEERRDVSALLTRAILLVLLGGEPAWREERPAAGAARLLELAARAEAAAAESGDPGLRANARYATAQVQTAHASLEAGLAALQEARELAREAGDAVAEFAILLSLGHHLDSKDLAAGRAVLEEARALLAEDACAEQLGEERLAVESARLDSVIGVAEFDLGNYGEALRLLTSSSQALREARRRYDAAWSLAFLAQVYTAIGLHEESAATLGEAIAIFADDRGSLGTRGYLRALLGRAYVEWRPPRLGEARRELEIARAETVASGYRPVLPLVETHWAELLVAEGTEDALGEADGVLEATARVAKEFGWARSEIAASSLRARVALARGSLDEAVELSTAAVEELLRRGGVVPAVRSEEILYAHHLVLAAAGSPEAAKPLAEAAALVHRKAESLDDPSQRHSFLARVRLSEEILAAAGDG